MQGDRIVDACRARLAEHNPTQYQKRMHELFLWNCARVIYGDEYDEKLVEERNEWQWVKHPNYLRPMCGGVVPLIGAGIIAAHKPMVVHACISEHRFRQFLADLFKYGIIAERTRTEITLEVLGGGQSKIILCPCARLHPGAGAAAVQYVIECGADLIISDDALTTTHAYEYIAPKLGPKTRWVHFRDTEEGVIYIVR